MKMYEKETEKICDAWHSILPKISSLAAIEKQYSSAIHTLITNHDAESKLFRGEHGKHLEACD